jgi:hypothetical protein
MATFEKSRRSIQKPIRSRYHRSEAISCGRAVLYGGLVSTTRSCVEKARSQFLSLHGEAHAEILPTHTRTLSAYVKDALRFLAAAIEGQAKSAVSPGPGLTPSGSEGSATWCRAAGNFRFGRGRGPHRVVYIGSENPDRYAAAICIRVRPDCLLRGYSVGESWRLSVPGKV